MMLRSLPLTLLPLAASASDPLSEIIHGHYEIHVDYTLTPGNPDAGWKFSTSYDLDGNFLDRHQVIRLDPGTTPFVATPVTRQPITPALSRFGSVGEWMWILPINQVTGALYIGVRTIMNPGIFQSRSGGNYAPSPAGSVSMRLVSVTGTGPDAGGRFGAWYTDTFGGLVFPFDTSNGISAADEIPTIPASSHTHYSWGMTKPGTYHVTFEVFGKINPGQPDAETITKAQKTFTFHVPFSGEVLEGHEIRISPEPLLSQPAESVAYKADRAMICANVPDGPGWKTTGTMATAPLAIANGVGVTPEAASLLPAGWSNLTVKMIGVTGPGQFAWLDGNGSPLDLQSGLPIGSSERRTVTATFSEKGIYRVHFVVSGVYQGIAAYHSATVVYGAGLGADFTYQDWATSFERSADIALGALSDPTGDHDGDGLTNGSEYALFWHGFDPAVADGGKMPRAFPTAEGFAAFDFLRDTLKDPLTGAGWRILPQASRDLIQWKTLSPVIISFPLETFETSAEEGNARGAIMKRRVRMMPGPEPRAFFRFQITSP
ncbi:choice-of-anchor M domain-containing protein [Luteolibacter sp. SL250]|uniref:choice-of-anchor M domain-containing protein n=1 Tax=Luteolibacter sp. SL250 TaxID=2995170 RepID=UPI002270A58B|nr:choice-of-anchor M domain-containing protein [Luteolibacter sp. SL250]WAC21239.1 choice-of-anchor M domain-containing protein [Luteolibacter sp. SL250]